MEQRLRPPNWVRRGGRGSERRVFPNIPPGIGKKNNGGPETARHGVPSLQKRYFTLLQAIHHAEVVERSERSGTFPVGMMRQVNKLTSFIKPSAPNADTAGRVKANTDRWMEQNLSILKHHYDAVLAGGLESLPPFEQVALEKAIAYGRARYKNRLTGTSIVALTSLVGGGVGPPIREPGSVMDSREWPPLPTLSDPNPNPNPNPNPDPNPNSELNHDLNPDPNPGLCPDFNSSPEPNPGPSPDLCPNPGLPIMGVETLEGPNTRSRIQTLTAEIHHAQSPLPSEESLDSHPNLQLGPPVSSLEEESSPGLVNGRPLVVGAEFRSNVSVAISESIDSSSQPESGMGHHPVDTGVTQRGDVPGGLAASEDVMQPSSRGPTRHLNHSNDVGKREWSLTVERPVLFIGDSNSTHFPLCNNPLVQVDSFPGARILHLTGILGRLSPCVETQKVILSVGLNNCLKLNSIDTIAKQFGILVTKAKKIFPHAEIFIPLVQI